MDPNRTGEPVDHHVEPRGRGWAVREEGAQQAQGLFATREQAEHRALHRARESGGEVVVHDRRGDVSERRLAE